MVWSPVTVGSAIGIAALLIGRLVWVRRNPRPCPWWLRYLLENPYMGSLAGASALIERMGLQRGMSVLDVGCGPGRLTIPFAEEVGIHGSVTALDVQAKMLDLVRARVARERLSNVQIIQGQAGEGEIRWEGVFDRAVLVTVLGEIPKKRQALQEIFCALKPGGILSVTEVLPDPDYQRASVVATLCREAGFDFDRRFGNLLAFTLNFRKPCIESPTRSTGPPGSTAGVNRSGQENAES